MMQIEKREPVKCLILSIVTCGIYALIWYFKMGKEAAKVKNPDEEGTIDGILCLFIPFIGFFLAEKKFAEGCQAMGIQHEDKSVLYLILGLVFNPIAGYMMQSELNKVADALEAANAQGYYQAQEVPYQNVDNNQQF